MPFCLLCLFFRFDALFCRPVRIIVFTVYGFVRADSDIIFLFGFQFGNSFRSLFRLDVSGCFRTFEFPVDRILNFITARLHGLFFPFHEESFLFGGYFGNFCSFWHDVKCLCHGSAVAALERDRYARLSNVCMIGILYGIAGICNRLSLIVCYKNRGRLSFAVIGYFCGGELNVICR